MPEGGAALCWPAAASMERRSRPPLVLARPPPPETCTHSLIALIPPSSARHSNPASKGGTEEWKDALAGVQVVAPAEGEEAAEDPFDTPPPAAWDDGEGDGVVASFDLDGPDEDGEVTGGTDADDLEASWDLTDGEGEGEFAFIPNGPGGGGRGGGRASSSSGVVEEILFSLEGGWGLEALSAAEAAAAAGAAQVLTSKPGRRGGGGGGGADEEEEGEPAPHPKSALASIPAHVLAALKAAQAAALADAATTTPNALRRAAAERRIHRRLRIIGGSSSGRRLLSGAGETTRPMMDKVRAAVFDALSAGGAAGPGRLPPGCTWLDLYAGTGAVGLEALSRGAGGATFVEMDPWVSSSVLGPNLAACAADWASDGRDDPAPVATPVQGKAEDFLARHPGPPFDYISVCPPYEAVTYTDLMGLLASSAGRILHAHSFVIVEYPRLAAREMPARLGPLARLRDRKYGRTLLAIYGPE